MKGLAGLFQKRMMVSRALGLLGVPAFLCVEPAWGPAYRIPMAYLAFAGLLLVAVGVAGRVWSVAYLAGRKDKVLVVDGPFSICRNPLYLFSFMGVLGLCLYTKMLTIVLLVMPFFVWVHARSVRREETRLRARFGEAYDAYTRRVPRLIPSFAHFSESEALPVNGVLFRRGVMEVMLFFILIGLFELAEALHAAGVIVPRLALY